MLRSLIVAGMAAAWVGATPAAAGSWSVGVGVGVGPGYYGHGYYPPRYYRRHRLYAPPAYVYAAPPVVYAPAPPPVVYAPPPVASALPADAVFDRLEASGYGGFGVMAFRDGVYKLDAVNPHGDRVSLEVSALTGDVQAEYVIGAAEPRRRAPATGAAPAEDDPLVVY